MTADLGVWEPRPSVLTSSHQHRRWAAPAWPACPLHMYALWSTMGFFSGLCGNSILWNPRSYLIEKGRTRWGMKAEVPRSETSSSDLLERCGRTASGLSLMDENQNFLQWRLKHRQAATYSDELSKPDVSKSTRGSQAPPRSPPSPPEHLPQFRWDVDEMCFS